MILRLRAKDLCPATVSRQVGEENLLLKGTGWVFLAVVVAILKLILQASR